MIFKLRLKKEVVYFWLTSKEAAALWEICFLLLIIVFSFGKAMVQIVNLNLLAFL